MWDLIVSVPDHCLSFYSAVTLDGLNSDPCYPVFFLKEIINSSTKI